MPLNSYENNEEYQINKKEWLKFYNENSTVEIKKQTREKYRQEALQKQSAFNKVKEKISDFRLVKAINTYRKNMRNYFGEEVVGSNFDETVGDINPNKSKKATRANFAQTLYGVVNHKKAQESAQKNANIKERHEVRTL